MRSERGVALRASVPDSAASLKVLCSDCAGTALLFVDVVSYSSWNDRKYLHHFRWSVGPTVDLLILTLEHTAAHDHDLMKLCWLLLLEPTASLARASARRLPPPPLPPPLPMLRRASTPAALLPADASRHLVCLFGAFTSVTVSEALTAQAMPRMSKATL